MPPSSLRWLVLVSTGCMVRIPHPPGVALSVRAAVHADVHVQAPEAAVAIQNAPVVEFFGIPLDGADDVVFVLDKSGSMSEAATGTLAGVAAPAAPASGSASPPSKIDVAHEELTDALRRLPAGTHLDVIFFDSDVGAFAPGIVALDDTGRDQMISYVDAAAAEGSTALAPAMRLAFLMNPKRVVLLSDGLGNVGGGSRDVLRDAREAMLGGVRIDAVGLGKDQDASLLATLAHESGGLYQAF